MMTFPLPPTRTSSAKPCECTVCLLARAKGYEIVKLKEAAVEKPDKIPEVEGPAILKQCQQCFSYIGKGWGHKCDKASKRANLEAIVKSSSKKSRTRMVSTGLKQVFSEAGVSTRGGTLGLETKGKPLTVNLGAKAPIKNSKWDLESLIKLQTKANLADKTLL